MSRPLQRSLTGLWYWCRVEYSSQQKYIQKIHTERADDLLHPIQLGALQSQGYVHPTLIRTAVQTSHLESRHGAVIVDTEISGWQI